MTAPLRLALPSKGRLLDPVLSFLASCGFAVKTGAGSRDYTARIPSLPDCVVDLTAASEIPQRLMTGEVHLGVTGLDLVSELTGHPPADLDRAATRAKGAPLAVRPLGFGRADLVVACPRAWIDVDTMTDLAEVAQAFRRRHGRRLRIATKYRTLTRGFFSAHGVGDYRIVRSDGATEATPATGVADIIVDITSTGETLAANHLKPLRNGVILASQATLFVTGAPSAPWSDAARAALRRFLDMVDAKTSAASRKMLRARLPGNAAAGAPLDQALDTLISGPVEIMPHHGEGPGFSVMLTAPAERIYEVVQILRAHNAREVIVHDTDYVFGDGPSSVDKLAVALGWPTDAPARPS